MNMFPSTSSLPQEIIENFHYSRRLLQPTPPQTPSPTYQVLDPDGSTHGNNYDTNIVTILAVLICALIGSLCINTLIKCAIKCSSLIRGEPTYYLNMINHEKNKTCGLDKGALKTFPVVKYSKEVKIIQGLSSNECVICLLEFKCGEKVRILPNCNHGFHAKCIDKWLNSNSSCPTCRQSLVETCKKIIIGSGVNDDHHEISSPSSTSSREVNTISIIVPLERED